MVASVNVVHIRNSLVHSIDFFLQWSLHSSRRIANKLIIHVQILMSAMRNIRQNVYSLSEYSRIVGLVQIKECKSSKPVTRMG